MSPKPPIRARTRLSRNPDADSANAVPRPVSAFARTDPAGHVIRRHRHARDQLLYGIRGVMRIHAQDAIWTLPASYSLWVPAFVQHAIHMETAVEMRTLYFQPGVLALPRERCQVQAVSPLLRELIVRAMDVPPLYDPQGPDGRLMQLIVDEVGCQPAAPLLLRLPQDRRLARLCRHLLSSLEQTQTIAELGLRFGLSERSIIRRFPAETGLSLHQWRQQARLMRAFAMADEGRPLGEIATELGYGSPSAFAKMFRKVFNRAPREVLGAPV